MFGALRGTVRVMDPVVDHRWNGPVAIASMALAAAIAVVASAVALAPQLVGSSSSDVLRPTTALQQDLENMDWVCREQPGAGSIVLELCEAPRSLDPVLAAVIIETGDGGIPRGIQIKADVLGYSNPTREDIRIGLVEHLAGLTFSHPGDAQTARRWLDQQIPVRGSIRTLKTIGGIQVLLTTSVGGGYVIEIGEAVPIGSAATRSAESATGSPATGSAATVSGLR